MRLPDREHPCCPWSPRRASAAGVRSRTVHASMNCAVGVYIAGARVFPLVDAPAGRILRVISFEQLWRDAAANNGRARSRARSESRANSSEKTAWNSEG